MGFARKKKVCITSTKPASAGFFITWISGAVNAAVSRKSRHSQATLNRVARKLNERPRETLVFETPAERFNACVASTG